MSEFKLTIVIPDLPPTTNQLNGMTWQQRKNKKDKWQRLVRHAVGNTKPPKPLKRAQITCIRHSSRRADNDGMIGSFKSLIDALVHLNILEDDNFEVIGKPSYHWQVAPPGKGGVEIRVEELSEEFVWKEVPCLLIKEA